ncbi:EamA family transporter [Microcoleus sp. FACHB-1515]|nr:EamA family transporter [Microcoleus sp. FACHB-1515]
MQPDDPTWKLTQDLQNLQQSLVTGLTQDVTRLQAEKSRLLSDIQKLQAQQRSLQQNVELDLTQQQLQQQQIWAKQLAQALATQLQALLVERIQSAEQASFNPTGDPEATARSIAALDATLNRIASSVNQDLSSYQSSLSQQLSRMHNLEQQGEAILEALVSRLNQQLQASARPAPVLRSQEVPQLQLPPAVAPVPLPPAVRQSVQSPFQTGVLLVLLSTVALSLHNVVVRIIGFSNRVFGFYDLGGFISLNLGNSMLILWMRMIIVVPLMIFLGNTIYPAAWRDLRSFLESRDRSILAAVTSSGFFLFLSQVLIYIAIGQVGPGVAVTILFMYPLVTVPLAWLLFRDRPTRLRIAVMVAILSGVILTAFPKLAASESISWLGIFAAVAAGISFACYLIAMQLSFRKLHPVPVSIIQFTTIFVLTSLSLIFFPTRLGLDVLPEGRLGLIGGGVVLGTLTLAGYLLNNYGVRYLGAARASIIASSGPVLTALLAFVILPGDPSNALQRIQWLGILIVTLGVLALSFEKLLMQRRAKPVG